MNRPAARNRGRSFEGGASRGAIRASCTAETRYDTASTSRATGAENTCTRKPPALGPTTFAMARLPLLSELPAT